MQVDWSRIQIEPSDGSTCESCGLPGHALTRLRPTKISVRLLPMCSYRITCCQPEVSGVTSPTLTVMVGIQPDGKIAELSPSNPFVFTVDFRRIRGFRRVAVVGEVLTRRLSAVQGKPCSAHASFVRRFSRMNR